MSTKREAALAYAAMGWRIFPVKDGTKAGQLLTSWKESATSDPAIVARWWDTWPDANICLATGVGTAVIDCDSPAHKQGGNGPDGIQGLRDWQAAHGAFPATLTAITPSEGEHLYYLVEGPVANRTGIIPGVDVRGDGGYVLLPPSVVDGKAYRWKEGQSGKEAANTPVLHFLGLREQPAPQDGFTAAIHAHELERLTTALASIPCADLDYNSWVHVGMALRNCGASVDVWDVWSQTDPARYVDGECVRKWASFSTSESHWNAGTIFKLAKQYRYKPQSEDTIPLSRFHKLNKDGVPTDTLDDAIENYLLEEYDMLVLHGKLYVYSDGCYRMDEDGKKIMGIIRKLIDPRLVTAQRLQRVFTLLLLDERISVDEDGVNLHPATWICFKNGMLDVLTGDMHSHDPGYKSINQIPHDYDPTATYEGSVAEKFFEVLIPDPGDREMFYAYVGLCMTRHTGFQKFLVLLGIPGAGKSTAANLVLLAIGRENVSGLPLQYLGARFQSVALMNKLANVSSDIPSTEMEQTSVIRLITGEDPVHGEYKGGKSFDFKNYARLMFTANELPAIVAEDPDAFYRRLMVIDVTKRGPEIRCLDEGLKASLSGFIVRCVQSLQAHFAWELPLDSPKSLEAVNALRLEADSFASFFNECITQDEKGKIPTTGLYDRYRGYCWSKSWKPKGKHRFFEAVRALGYRDGGSDGKTYFFGLAYKAG